MTQPPAPPVTLVTGAAGAVGTALVGELLARGHRVAALDRQAAPLDARGKSRQAGLLPLALDATAASAWPGALAKIADALGPPTGAVLVAGTWAGGTPVAEEADDGTFRKMMDVNVETMQTALRAVLPGMVERRRGAIVVIGSRAVERPWESAGATAYAAAKAAVVTYAQAVAQEVLESCVRINAVLPSMIDTPANRSAMPTADTQAWVSTERLAKVIAFLLSDDAGDITGAALPVYGRM